MKYESSLVISIELLFTFCSGNNLEQTVFAKLRPGELYSIDFKCGSFNKIGKYEINYNEKRRNYFAKSVTVRDNQSYKKYRIPINLPSNLLGFRRYDECINAKKIVLLNSK